MTQGRPKSIAGYLFVGPAMLYLGVFTVLPMVVAAYLSFHHWHLLKPDHPFVGLDNYRRLLDDPYFVNAIQNTIAFTALSVPVGMAVALAAAVLLNRSIPGIRLFRTVFYIPSVCSQVALSMIWIWVTLPNAGFFNWLIGGLNACLGTSFSTDVNFLTRFPMISVVLLFIWNGLGPRMVIFLAGLQNIPESLYEAARVDGATGWQRFRHITMPLLAPTTFFILVTTTIAALQIFTPIYVMTQGGPNRATDVVVFHIYKEAWHKFHIGQASAMSYVLFSIIMVISLLQFWVMKRRSDSIAEAV
ncbi:MAG TPA: sugar ABC transporter permease [Phycisphaerae bacterium]|nr:sugar ABC transporter permease [Phycisphaerae bacterium]HRW52272.1 sugar ABC transporter permease [Phycisphaerae bacterium]